MIATILPGSADFHAVGYNEHKVYKGVATLLENIKSLDPLLYSKLTIKKILELSREKCILTRVSFNYNSL